MKQEIYGPRVQENKEGISYVDKVLRSADSAGRLDVNSVWALFCLILIFYVVWKERWYRKDREASQKISTDHANTMLLTATAVVKMSDAFERLEIVIDERLQRRV